LDEYFESLKTEIENEYENLKEIRDRLKKELSSPTSKKDNYNDSYWYEEF